MLTNIPVITKRRWAARFTSSIALGLTIGLMLPAYGHAEDEAMHHDHMAMGHDDMHAMHHHPEADAIVRTQISNEIPDVTMIGMNGEKVNLRSELNNSPVLVDFIFTTCSTICPALSATMSDVQQTLAKEGIKAHLVSISIDPEQDTPAQLKAYAAKFNAGPGWEFFTGTLADSIAVQKAFNAYRGDKMNHTALTLLRSSPNAPWVRIDGFISSKELVAEYRKAVDASLAQK